MTAYKGLNSKRFCGKVALCNPLQPLGSEVLCFMASLKFWCFVFYNLVSVCIIRSFPFLLFLQTRETVLMTDAQ